LVEGLAAFSPALRPYAGEGVQAAPTLRAMEPGETLAGSEKGGLAGEENEPGAPAPPPMQTPEVGGAGVAEEWRENPPRPPELPTLLPEEKEKERGPGERQPAELAKTFAKRAGWEMPSFGKTKGGETIDWEMLIGGSWLNVIGMTVLVLGMVFLTEYSLPRLVF
jgi:uncharacterized membrane protein